VTREEAIQTISGLFPPDAGYMSTREIGERLLKEAKAEARGWKTEPTEVLICFANKCIAEEATRGRE